MGLPVDTRPLSNNRQGIDQFSTDAFGGVGVGVARPNTPNYPQLRNFYN
jgi:hypothetical protein